MVEPLRARSHARLLVHRTRAAGLSRIGARGLAATALIVAIAILAAGIGTAPDPIDGTAEAALVDAMRHGGPFYAVAGDMARGGATFGAWTALPLPTFGVVAAALPLVAVVLLLWALAAGTLLAFADALHGALRTRSALVSALVLLTAGMVAILDPARIEMRQAWSGLLIALSLARRRPGRVAEAVAFGLAAALVAELAAPYLAAMALCAAVAGDRRELAGWALAIGVFALALALHAHTVAAFGLPPAATRDAAGLPAWIAALADQSALHLVPSWIAASLLLLALLGWAAWRSALAVRVLAAVLVFTVLGAASPPDRVGGIALLVVPVWLLGLAFTPDALRDLAAAALDKRRITVRRVVR